MKVQIHLFYDTVELSDGHFIQVADVLPTSIIGTESEGQPLLFIRQSLDQILISGDQGLLGKQHMYPGDADDIAHVDAGGVIVGREIDVKSSTGFQNP